MEADWEGHWDVLNITLEVMHFARDAQLAEEWIVKEDLNLYGKDKGVSFVIFYIIFMSTITSTFNYEILKGCVILRLIALYERMIKKG